MIRALVGGWGLPLGARLESVLEERRGGTIMARPIRLLVFLLAPALVVVPTAADGPDRALANSATHAQTEALPRRPLPPDMVEGFGEGRVLAFHYQLSYICPTTPGSDLDGPFGHGDGLPQAEDPTEYQVPTCFFGKGAESIVPAGLRLSGSLPVRKLYGIVPFFGGSPVHSNAPGTDVQTQCSQPGPPFTQVKGPFGTCLMHPMHYRVFPNTGDPPFPDPTLGPQHSHVIEGTDHPAGWWNAVAIMITDRSIFPDNNGNCPAGPPACVTSLGALRAAQARGLASPDIPSNLYFFFSVSPVANPEPGGVGRPAAQRPGAAAPPETAVPTLRAFVCRFSDSGISAEESIVRSRGRIP